MSTRGEVTKKKRDAARDHFVIAGTPPSPACVSLVADVCEMFVQCLTPLFLAFREVR